MAQQSMFGGKPASKSSTRKAKPKAAPKTGLVKVSGYHVKGKTIQRKPYDVKGHTRKRGKS